MGRILCTCLPHPSFRGPSCRDSLTDAVSQSRRSTHSKDNDSPLWSIQKDAFNDRKTEEPILMFATHSTSALKKDPSLAGYGWKVELNQISYLSRYFQERNAISETVEPCSKAFLLLLSGRCGRRRCSHCDVSTSASPSPHPHAPFLPDVQRRVCIDPLSSRPSSARRPTLSASAFLLSPHCVNIPKLVPPDSSRGMFTDCLILPRVCLRTELEGLSLSSPFSTLIPNVDR